MPAIRRSLKPRRRPSGFTLVEVAVVVLILAIAIGVTTATFRGRFTDSYEDGLLQELGNLRSAITAYQQDVGKYPPLLYYLVAIPNGGVDGCGTSSLTANQIAHFRGPYITRTLTSSQTSYVFGRKDTVYMLLDFPDHTVNSDGSQTNWLGIQVAGLDLTTAQDIDKKIDGTVDPNHGAIRYVNAGTYYILTYAFPVKKGAC